MRLSSITLIILIGIITMASCRGDDPVEQPETPNRTLLVYMPYTGTQSLYSFFVQAMNNIEKAIETNKGLANNQVVYFIAKNTRTSYLINVEYKNGKAVRDTLKTYTNHDFVSQAGFNEVFADVKRYVPANEYAMCIEAHGEGWLPGDTESAAKLLWFGAYQKGFKTSVTTLVDAIKASDIHMKYILFDCCYMANIETVYDVRNVCDYVIASTSEILAQGIPYNTLLMSLLQENPDYKKIVEGFYDFYNNYTYPYGTLSVINTAYIEDMAEIMRQINEKYTISDEVAATVMDLDAGHHNPTIFFDFGDYVKKMIGNKDEYGLLQQFNGKLSQLVPYKSNTEKIISMVDMQTVNVNGYSGLTISDISAEYTAFTAKEYTAWWARTHSTDR